MRTLAGTGILVQEAALKFTDGITVVERAAIKVSGAGIFCDPQ
jgi:hypothetical protein